MNKHLELVREFLEEFAFPYPAYGANVTLNDMEIITRQALLMKEGSNTIYRNSDQLSKTKPYDEPDLSNCLFE